MIMRWFRRREAPRLQVLMVCMGNLCRSPMAEGVLRAKLDLAGLAGEVAVDSAGTHGFARSSLPDSRAVARSLSRGYRIERLKSRPLVAADFARFDWLLAMDRGNLATLRERCPPPQQPRLHLLLPFGRATTESAGGHAVLSSAGLLPADEVPDPYYGNLAGFDQALDLIEPACDGLIRLLRLRLADGP
jgi:protein-tyrosine phosphatase